MRITKVTGETSNVTLNDVNFVLIMKAILWDSRVEAAICELSQFQISTNITAVITTFVSVVVLDQEVRFLTTFQLF